ncbi:hypothetical protein N9B53_04485, partial [Mariniblastus sp.]|nr:hypothetical protein [Mariniblastus sp.]
RVHRLINTTVSDLTQSCQTALNDFGFTAATRIDSAVDNVSAQLIERDKHTIKTKIHIADSAIKLLPAPAGA